MKTRILRATFFMTIASIFVAVPVFAQASTTMTDGHIARIRSNCQTARITLSQIHANDAPVYINRNQTYFSISDKLMARLNSRLTLNRYDATQLVRTASEYNTMLAKFREVNKDYNDAITGAIRTDCKKEPVGFYDKVTRTRESRQNVRDIANELTRLINQYQQQVQLFKDKHFPEKDGRI